MSQQFVKLSPSLQIWKGHMPVPSELHKIIDKLRNQSSTKYFQYNQEKYLTLLDPNTFMKNVHHDANDAYNADVNDITSNAVDDNCDNSKAQLSSEHMCPTYFANAMQFFKNDSEDDHNYSSRSHIEAAIEADAKQFACSKICGYRWKTATVKWQDDQFKFQSSLYRLPTSRNPDLYKISEHILTLAKPYLEQIVLLPWPEDTANVETFFNKFWSEERSYNPKEEKRDDQCPFDDSVYGGTCIIDTDSNGKNFYGSIQMGDPYYYGYDNPPKQYIKQQLQAFKSTMQLYPKGAEDSSNFIRRLWNVYRKNSKSKYCTKLKIEHNTSLQIALKIQHVKTQAKGGSYEGVYHTDGGIHQRVIAVVLYYYQVPDSLKGGEMEFLWKGGIDAGFRDKGEIKQSWETRPHITTPIKQGDILIFSNQEVVHKVLKMVNEDPNHVNERGFLAYFIIDPRFKSPSTDLYDHVLQAVKNLDFPACLILSYLNDYSTLYESKKRREEIFQHQMLAKDMDGFRIYTNGNADCHEIIHESFMMHQPGGRQIGKDSDFSSYQDDNLWL